MQHYTTFVLPRATSGLDYDVPVIVLAAEQHANPARLPTSLHRIGNEVMLYSHASPLDQLGPVPVTDAWIATVDDQYDHRAKIAVALDPLPRDIGTEYAPAAEGVPGEDLPPWVPDLLTGRIRAAMRDVPVSAGPSGLDIWIDPDAPVALPAWAHQIIGEAPDNGE